MDKKTKIGYLVSTGLLSLMMVMSASMYVFKHADIAATFESLGFPTFIIYPLAVLKIAGVAVLWMGSPKIKEWAYTGFFFNFLLAFGAHLNIGDGDAGGAVMALVLLVLSYFFNHKKEEGLQGALSS